MIEVWQETLNYYKSEGFLTGKYKMWRHICLLNVNVNTNGQLGKSIHIKKQYYDEKWPKMVQHIDHMLEMQLLHLSIYIAKLKI